MLVLVLQMVLLDHYFASISAFASALLSVALWSTFFTRSNVLILASITIVDAADASHWSEPLNDGLVLSGRTIVIYRS